MDGTSKKLACVAGFAMVCHFMSSGGVAGAGVGIRAPGKAMNSFAGRYVAFAHRLGTCESEKGHELNLRVTHYNPSKPLEKQNITGNWTARVDLDDAMWGRVRLDVRSNNQWKENAFQFNFPKSACSALRANVPDFFHVMFKLGANAEDPKSACRVPARVYLVNNEPVAWYFPNFPVMPYGHYRFVMKIGKAQADLMCFVADCQINPRPT